MRRMIERIRRWSHNRDHPWGHKVWFAGNGCERCVVDLRGVEFVRRRREEERRKEELSRKVPRRM